MKTSRRMLLVFLFLAVPALSLPPLEAPAKTYTVSSTTDPAAELSTYIATADCDSIEFAEALFDADGNSTIDLSAEIAISRDPTITGPSDKTLTLTNSSSGRVFSSTTSNITITLNHLTLSDLKSAETKGGAIYVENAALSAMKLANEKSVAAIWEIFAVGE